MVLTKCFIKKGLGDDGFTLIELVLVVAILGILLSLAVPKFTMQIEETKKVACQTNQRLIENAASLYEIQNEKAAKTIDELVEAGYLTKPKCPKNGEYTIHEESGEVKCSLEEHKR